MTLPAMPALRCAPRPALAAAITLCLALSACNKDTPPRAPAAKPAATPAAAPAPTVSAQMASLGADQLRESAQKALAEQRLYAPVGNNAMEYYLALRDKAPGDAAVASALNDLQPYTLIATEQAIARKDVAEANRLYALLEKADSAAPALPRLKNAIAEAERTAAAAPAVAAEQTPEEKARQAELERKRAEEQKKLQEQAAKELAAKQAQQAQQAQTQQAAAAKAAAEKAAADRAAADKAAADRAAADKAAADRVAAQKAEADRRAAERAEADRRAAQAQAAAARPTSNELRAISQPQPRYPAEAQRSGTAGSVTVEFTVNPDGSVGNARVVSGNPPRVFDREALNAIKRWRYEPTGASVTSRRTFQFAPGQ